MNGLASEWSPRMDMRCAVRFPVRSTKCMKNLWMAEAWLAERDVSEGGLSYLGMSDLIR